VPRQFKRHTLRSGAPAYTTIKPPCTGGLETKGAVRIVKRISNANIFEAVISRDDAQSRVWTSTCFCSVARLSRNGPFGETGQ